MSGIPDAIGIITMGRLTTAGLHPPYSYIIRGRLALAVLEEGGGSSGGVASIGEEYRYRRDEIISAEQRARIEADDREMLEILMLWTMMRGDL